MSIMRCDIHGSWDSDFKEYCPRCEPPIPSESETPPERVYVTVKGQAFSRSRMTDRGLKSSTEYIRADKYAELEKQLSAATAALKEARDKALIEAENIAVKEYKLMKDTEEAHYRNSPTPFFMENFGFNQAVVRYSAYVASEIHRLKSKRDGVE